MEEEEKKKRQIVTNRVPIIIRDTVTNKPPVTARAL